jgi:hypothetical protein
MGLLLVVVAGMVTTRQGRKETVRSADEEKHGDAHCLEVRQRHRAIFDQQGRFVRPLCPIVAMVKCDTVAWLSLCSFVIYYEHVRRFRSPPW